jgi:hypothetical protein
MEMATMERKKHFFMLLAVMWLLIAALTSARVEANYRIDVYWHGHLEATVQYEWRDTVWTTINRWFDQHRAMYVNSDELKFQITPDTDKAVWFMYGCVTDNELIITANDPLYCKVAREDFEK